MSELIDMRGFEPDYHSVHDENRAGHRIMVVYYKRGWALECWTDGPHDWFWLENMNTRKRKHYKTLTGAVKGAKP